MWGRRAGGRGQVGRGGTIRLCETKEAERRRVCVWRRGSNMNLVEHEDDCGLQHRLTNEEVKKATKPPGGEGGERTIRLQSFLSRLQSSGFFSHEYCAALSTSSTRTRTRTRRSIRTRTRVVNSPPAPLAPPPPPPRPPPYLHGEQKPQVAVRRLLPGTSANERSNAGSLPFPP